jgi:hypothetical protein
MPPPTRREFLEQAGRATAAIAGLGLVTGHSFAGEIGSAATLPAVGSRPSSPQIDPSVKSIVADVRAREVVADTVIHETLLLEMIEEAVRLATGTSSAGEAWNKLIKPDDVVGIKFNQIGAETIRTTGPFTGRLVESLKLAGFAPDRIILIEVPTRLTQELKTRPCPLGFSGGKVSFGSGEDELAAVLEEVTVLVNVPFLKTHNIAQMTGCLKNLSHALVRRPKLCHDHGCTPFVGDILALPQIRPKMRIHIVNALRAVFEGGPLPSADALWTHSGILVSTDPVAADQIAIEILNAERSRRGLPVIGDRDGHVPHVRAAAERGLGTDDQDYITVHQPALF